MDIFNINCLTEQVAVTATATSLPINNNCQNIRLVNTGTNTIFVAIGDSTVVATPASATRSRSSLPILAGAIEVFSRYGKDTTLSFVCAATLTSTMIVSYSEGQ